MMMKGQLHSIQLLRGAAALAVVLFHLAGSLKDDFGMFAANPFPMGSDGVDIFFVISGFIMCYTTARADQRSPADFALKRAARIIPIYYLLTLALFAVGLALPSLLNSGSSTLEELTKSLLFIPYERVDGRVAPVLFLGWTLNYEMFFYVVFTLALILAPRYRIQFVLGVMAVLVGIGWANPNSNSLLFDFYTSGLLLEFVWGCLIFVIFDLYPAAARRTAALWILGVAALLVQNFYNVPLSREVEKGLPAALIVWGVLGLDLKDGPVRRSAARLGDASYSLYLGHPYVIESVGKIAIAVAGVSVVSGLAAALISLVICIALALLSFQILEKPSNSWLRKRALGSPQKSPSNP